MTQGSINHEKETQVSPALVRRLFCSETGACGSHVCPVLGARRRVILIGFWDSVRTPNVFSLPRKSVPYLSLLLLHPQDSRCDLDGGQGLRVATSCSRDVRDHGGATVHVPQRLPQKHGELALPAKQSGLRLH